MRQSACSNPLPAAATVPHERQLGERDRQPVRRLLDANSPGRVCRRDGRAVVSLDTELFHEYAKVA
jgi:hypothetical protein